MAKRTICAGKSANNRVSKQSAKLGKAGRQRKRKDEDALHGGGGKCSRVPQIPGRPTPATFRATRYSKRDTTRKRPFSPSSTDLNRITRACSSVPRKRKRMDQYLSTIPHRSEVQDRGSRMLSSFLLQKLQEKTTGSFQKPQATICDSEVVAFAILNKCAGWRAKRVELSVSPIRFV
jgi:hypothetical protein